MPGILWGSSEEKEREWLFAKEKLSRNGKLLPNGTKLRRKDYPTELNHSFMVIDERIIALSGKGIHLGKGRDAHTKLAEDEGGNLIALKIFTDDWGESNSISEAYIGYDLGIAGQRITRTGASKNKYYIAYQYLGTRLFDFICNKSLSLDKCYELCIKISLALHEIHTGKKSKSKKSYGHNDIHGGNLVIDEQEEPHFIDFGRSGELYKGYTPSDDIVRMLLLFFTPIKDRDHRHQNWIFGNWIGEYTFLYDKPRFSEKFQKYIGKRNTIYLYVEPSDKIESGVFQKVHYMVRDSENVFQSGVIDLSGLELTSIKDKEEEEEEDDVEMFWYNLRSDDISRIENKVLEVANQNNHIINQKNRNEVLFNVLKDPTSFYKAKAPTALDIAETLTLCRLQLENYQDSLKIQAPDVRLEVIQILNIMSGELLRLYEQLSTLPSEGGLNQLVKKYIVSHLVSSSQELSEDSLDCLNVQLDETHTIKQRVDDIILNINQAREAYRAKTIPVSHDEPEERSKAEYINLEFDSSLQEVAPFPLDEDDPLNSLAIYAEQDKKSTNQPINETDIVPTFTLDESIESSVKEVQNEPITRDAERSFLRELKNLQATIDTLAAKEQELASSLPPKISSMTLKQQQALKAALDEANKVLKELHQRTNNEDQLQLSYYEEAVLLQFADICSHIAHGLYFVARSGADFSCDIFYATNNTSGIIRSVNYDINMHHSAMKHLSQMASSLEGSGWKNLRNALCVLAGLMLTACGILAAIPTGGTSLLLGLGAVAALTAGVGFFAGRDTGLAGAVSNVQMSTMKLSK